MATTSHSQSPSFALIFSLLVLPLIHCLTIDLIHRDSPNSPLHNANETPLQRYNNALHRGLSRYNSIYSKAAQIDVSTDQGQYLMKFSLGTPGVDIFAIVDTGSDLMWTQCQPCQHCYKQKNPIFNPSRSSSYSKLNCQSSECHLLDTVSCSSQKLCNFTYGYASSQLIQGQLATETVTFGSNTFRNVVFECGYNNTDTFNSNEMGLVGLGGRDLSFSSQINKRFKSNKFSYCLLPFHTDPNLTSKLFFGSHTVVSGEGHISTPLVTKEDKTFYFVTLKGISVGDKFVPFSSTISKGNVFIDTGVPPTLLPKDFYNRLKEEVKNAIKMSPYSDARFGDQLCYKTQSMNNVAPILTAQFEGVKVPLIATSTFVPSEDGIFCFAMQPIDGEGGIFGNFAQSSLLVEYDFARRKVLFKPSDCTKL